jgi:peptide/nickel transport system substrate-binding protein
VGLDGILTRRALLRVVAGAAVGLSTLVTACSNQANTTSNSNQASTPPKVDTSTATLTVMVGDFGTERKDGGVGGSMDGSQNYARLLHGFLVAVDANSRLVPGIASKWDVTPDGLTWTFTIRKGVKFHDGSDLTREDVQWSLLHIIGPEAFAWNSGASQFANTSQKVAKVELVGSDQVSVTTKTPVLDLVNLVSEASTLWAPIMPKRNQVHDVAAEAAYDVTPIGAGPMKLIDHVAGISMTFERFDDYYYQPKNGFTDDRRVPLRTVKLLAVPEDATRVAALRSGQADIVATAATSKDQVAAGGGQMIYAAEGLNLEARVWGAWETTTPLHDLRVRQALDYALDKTPIQSQLAGGADAFQVKGWSIVTPNTIGYSPAIDPRAFDPNKARQLLTEAGFPGGAGFGKLVVNTTLYSGIPYLADGAQLAAASWKKELGLDVEVRVTDSSALDTATKSGKLNGQIIWLYNKPRVDAATGVVNYYGDLKSASVYHRDQALSESVNQAVSIVDSDKRAEALQSLFVVLRDQTFVITSGYVNVVWGVGPRIAAWHPYALTRWPSALYTLSWK